MLPLFQFAHFLVVNKLPKIKDGMCSVETFHWKALKRHFFDGILLYSIAIDASPHSQIGWQGAQNFAVKIVRNNFHSLFLECWEKV